MSYNPLKSLPRRCVLVGSKVFRKLLILFILQPRRCVPPYPLCAPRALWAARGRNLLAGFHRLSARPGEPSPADERQAGLRPRPCQRFTLGRHASVARRSNFLRSVLMRSRRSTPGQMEILGGVASEAERCIRAASREGSPQSVRATRLLDQWAGRGRPAARPQARTATITSTVIERRQ